MSFDCQQLAALALAAVAACNPVASSAQSSESASNEPAATLTTWVVNCAADATGDGLACRMVQNLVVTETKQRLLSVIIQMPAGSVTPVMTLALPHGLDFSAGVTATIDEKEPFNMALKTSDQQGAYANAVFEEYLLEALKVGTKMKVSFRSFRTQAYNAGKSRAGFSAVLRKLTVN